MTTLKISRMICVALCLLVMAGSALAQNIPVLVFDFSKGTFLENEYFDHGKLKPQPFGSFATLRIINVNTFRWKVEVSGRSINYVTPIPSELQTIFRLTDVKQDQQSTEEGLGKATGAKDMMKIVSNNVEKTSETVAAAIAAAVPADPAAAEKKKNALDVLQKAMDDLVKACEEYVQLAEKIAEAKFTRIELINISKQKWESYSAMEERLPAPLSQTTMKEAYLEFAGYYAKSEGLYKNARLAADKYKILATADSAEKAEAQGYVDQIIKATDDFEEGHDLLYEDNFLKLIDDVMVLQEAMENQEYFVVNSPPIQMDGDFVFFDIKTTPAKTSDLMPYDFGKTFPVEVPIKGGLKVDFSVGPTFSFGNRSRDDKFFLAPGSTADSVVIRQRRNNNSLSPGIAAMMHAYRRTGKNVNVGGLFGVGAGFQSVSDANVSFYLGLSVVLGKSEKLMLNTGASILSVDRLKSTQYKLDRGYASDLDLSVVTEKVLKSSFFIGVSYNLTNRVEIK